MSRRWELENHRRSLGEIRDIMNAMKNLSYMETRKISGFLDVQHAVVKHIETVAADFLSFYPDTLNETTNPSTNIYLLIGAERGFCGDFNHALLRHYENMSLSSDIDQPQLISVGHKLSTALVNNERRIIFIDGASVVEEVGKVLNQIVTQLVSQQQQHESLNLYVLYHNDQQQIINQQLLPPFQDLLHQQTQAKHAPQLNLQPTDFLLDLSYHYLFAAIHEILYTSLMAESRQRLAHLEGAIQHMDNQSEALHRRSNILRQEEIIEEIEVILLGAVSLDDPFTQY